MATYHQSNNRGRHTTKDEPMSREEAGRRGAEARWGRDYDEHDYSGNGRRSNRSSYDDDDRGGSSGRGQGRMSREEAGRRGAEARWGRDYDEDDDSSYGRRSNRSSYDDDDNDDRGGSSSDRGQGRMSREEAGRRGAEARWGRDYDEDDNSSNGRRSSRSSYDDDDDDDRGGSSGRGQGHMSREEAGRRGAEARWGRDYNEDDDSSNGRRSNRSSYDDDDRGGSSGRGQGHMSREEAGRRGAEARWGGDYDEHDRSSSSNGRKRSRSSYDDDDDRGGSSGRGQGHMSRQEAGRLGAEARHNISEAEESAIARKAARTRKQNDPDAFHEMGKKGGRARTKNNN